MKSDFKTRLKDRALDVLDWIDYRPDPHWWQWMALPAVLAAAYFFTPMAMWPVLLLATVVITLAGMLFYGLVLGICVAWQVVREVFGEFFRRRQSQPQFGKRVYGVKNDPMIIQR
jgi:hypothetical protein